MKIIFAGTSDFAAPGLKNLIEQTPLVSGQKQHQIIEVITQPDRPQGRGLKETFSPVKKLALEHHLAISQPRSINEPETVREISGAKPDIMVVAAYGQKIGSAVRKIPRYGCVNIHASLLPKYRGAAPVARAILDGEKETGVTIFKIVEEMDAGPVLTQKTLIIDEKETAGELTNRLAQLGAELLLNTLTAMESGRINEKTQDESQATYAPKLKKTDGLVDWHKPAAQIGNLIRAMQPWPGAYTSWESEKKGLIKINIIEGEAIDNRDGVSNQPGRVIKTDKNGITVAAGQGTLNITRLQPAGQRELTAREFINGYRLKPGDNFKKV